MDVVDARMPMRSGEQEPPEDSAAVTGRVIAFGVDAVLLTAMLFIVAVVLAAAIGPATSLGSAPGAVGQRLVVHQHRIIAAAVLNGFIGAAYFVGFWAFGPWHAPRATPG